MWPARSIDVQGRTTKPIPQNKLDNCWQIEGWNFQKILNSNLPIRVCIETLRNTRKQKIHPLENLSFSETEN